MGGHLQPGKRFSLTLTTGEGKMNSLLRWRHRCPSFHPAINSSGRARSQSYHCISLLLKFVLPTNHMTTGRIWYRRKVNHVQFDLKMNSSDILSYSPGNSILLFFKLTQVSTLSCFHIVIQRGGRDIYMVI